MLITTIAQPSPTGYYKCLTSDMGSVYGGGKWAPGRRRFVRGELVLCERGIHMCRLEQILVWLTAVIVPVVRHSDELVSANDKTVTRWAVVGEPYTTWTGRTQCRFAADCAEHVLPIFERDYPDDKRPREAIAAVRRFADGQVSEGELAAAGDAAGAAARAAAWAAAGDAARDAARDAAWDAARAAAWDAAWAAERRWQAERLAFYLFGGSL